MAILRVENSCEDCNYKREEEEEVLYRRKIKAEVGTCLPLGATDANITNQPIISNRRKEKKFNAGDVELLEVDTLSSWKRRFRQGTYRSLDSLRSVS